MKKFIGILLPGLILLTGCQAPAGNTFTDADKAAIAEDVEAFTTRMLAGQWSDVAATFSEDTVFMPPYQDNVNGRAAVEAWFETFPALVSMEFTDYEIAGSGDMAYVTGHFAMTFSPDGETNISDSGTFLEVRERQEDGSWLVTRNMFNSSLPLPAPQ